MKHYLVTGGLGFIGHHLVNRLIEDGHRVTVVDDRRTAAVHEIAGADCQITSIDEYVPDPVYDGIFHLAGPVGPVGVLDHAGNIVPRIVRDAQSVAWWALDSDCPLVYVSTSEIYGKQPQPVDENDVRIFSPGSSARMEYAIGKLAAETMLLNTASLKVTIVRPFNVAGPGQKKLGGFVLPRFIEQALANEPLTVYQPGTQLRAFTHVYDIVDGINRAMAMGARGAAYNLGNPANTCSMKMLAHEVIKYAQSSSKVEIIDPRDLWGTSFHEAPDKIPNIELAQRYLGWEPRLSVEMIIRHMISTREYHPKAS